MHYLESIIHKHNTQTAIKIVTLSISVILKN